MNNLSVYATDILCDILVHAAANYILHLEKEGLINEKEAEDMIHDVYSKHAKSSRESIRKRSERAEKMVEQDEENNSSPEENVAHQS